MGSDQSIGGGTSGRGNTSYFGASPDFGEHGDRNIEETISSLQMERLYNRRPEYRPDNNRPETSQAPLRLKSPISISEPAPYLRKIGNVRTIVFGLKTDAPGSVIVSSEGLINRCSFVSKVRTIVSIPIPTKGDFMVEISPDMAKLEDIVVTPGFTMVIKHSLLFHAADEDDEAVFYREQKLFTGGSIYAIDINKNLEVKYDETSGGCVFCLENKASVAIAECGHLVTCDNCLENREARCHHCPFCNSPSTF